MESSVDDVLDLVLRARRRLAAGVLAEAFCGPVAGFLLAAAAVIGAARWGGRADLPGGFLLAAGIAAALAAGARLARGLPDEADAALHLDRTLGARERFSTVLETAGREPALAAWAARGALERATPGTVREALALRPPAALLPLLLASTFAAGILLLPSTVGPVPGEGGGGEISAAAPSAAGGSPAAAAAPAADGAAGRRGAAAPAAAAAGSESSTAAETLAALQDRARAAGDLGALRALAEAKAALASGDEATAAAALRRAASALGVSSGAAVPGVTGGGTAAAGEGKRPPSAEAFSPAAVPLRSRAAAERYFGRRP